jgi:hypothetical protein
MRLQVGATVGDVVAGVVVEALDETLYAAVLRAIGDTVEEMLRELEVLK